MNVLRDLLANGMKGMLKDGTLVKLRNGMKYLVVGDYLIGYLSHFKIDSYNDDLTFCGRLQYNGTCQIKEFIDTTLNKWDIMEIWTLKDMSNLHSMLEDEHDSWEGRFGTCLYKRDDEDNLETVEMTVMEISNALGKNVKIVKG